MTGQGKNCLVELEVFRAIFWTDVAELVATRLRECIRYRLDWRPSMFTRVRQSGALLEYVVMRHVMMMTEGDMNHEAQDSSYGGRVCAKMSFDAYFGIMDG